MRIFVEGRDYKTTYTKKFEERKLWVPPNPEELKSFLPGTVEKIHVKPGD
jgi:biotin carboxyl carrier protein